MTPPAEPAPVARPARPIELVVASANPDKVAEMEAVLRAAFGDRVHLVPRPPGVPDVVEDADTLEGNARLKARALVAATGLAAVADDTGLEVDALDGQPGVRAARYAEGQPGHDQDPYRANVDKLLAELAALGALGPSARSARFRTVVVVCFPDGRELVGEGVVEGAITTERHGSGGFGYDPVFQPKEGDGRTFAELRSDEKHAISHRGRALRAIVDKFPIRHP